MENNDRRTMHRQALAAATGYIDRITEPQLHSSTPCEGWNLQQLLDHMVGQHFGFAAAILEGDAPLSAYAPQHFTIESWQSSTSAMSDAFTAVDLAVEVLEVELDPHQPLPVAFLLVAQILDTVVHTWDVARAMGESFTPTPDVAKFVLAVASQIPDDEGRDKPRAAFAHSLADQDGPWPAALARLGRDPFWTSPAMTAPSRA